MLDILFFLLDFFFQLTTLLFFLFYPLLPLFPHVTPSFILSPHFTPSSPPPPPSLHAADLVILQHLSFQSVLEHENICLKARVKNPKNITAEWMKDEVPLDVSNDRRWCGAVWCGVVLCGVVWCGAVLCGVIWCGVV